MVETFDMVSALYAVKRQLRLSRGLEFVGERWLGRRHKALLIPRVGHPILVHFKKEFFYSYGQLTGDSGAGESINVTHLEEAEVRYDVQEIIYVYFKERMYSIMIKKIREVSYEYVNRKSGDAQFLFSIRHLEPIHSLARKVEKPKISYSAAIKSHSLNDFGGKNV